MTEPADRPGHRTLGDQKAKYCTNLFLREKLTRTVPRPPS